MSATGKKIEQKASDPRYHLPTKIEFSVTLTWIQFGQPAEVVQLHEEISSKAAIKSSPKRLWTCVHNNKNKINYGSEL
jgi:hypothetical protein